MICQLHQLLADLIPGGAKKSLSAAQARALLAGSGRGTRPGRRGGGSPRRWEARGGRRKATRTTLMTLDGIGPSGAARPLAGAGDITRFPTGATSPPGTGPRRPAPPPATTSATACPAPGTGRTAGCCTSWP